MATIRTEQQTVGRAEWVAAALGVLVADGIDQVRVERLARRLGITKGSFYHHFRDRADLHAAMLETWRQDMVNAVRADLDTIADPRERFRRMMRLPLEDSRAPLDVDVAIRLWARRDAGVRAVLDEVEAARIAYMARVMAECGVPAESLQQRAALAYAFLRTSDSPRDESLIAACEALLLAR